MGLQGNSTRHLHPHARYRQHSSHLHRRQFYAPPHRGAVPSQAPHSRLARSNHSRPAPPTNAKKHAADPPIELSYPARFHRPPPHFHYSTGEKHSSLQLLSCLACAAAAAGGAPGRCTWPPWRIEGRIERWHTPSLRGPPRQRCSPREGARNRTRSGMPGDRRTQRARQRWQPFADASAHRPAMLPRQRQPCEPRIHQMPSSPGTTRHCIRSATLRRKHGTSSKRKQP